MKIRRIPETDLAKISSKSEDEQKFFLRRLKGFRPPYTLNPFRKSLADIMNLQYELLGETNSTSWEIIQKQILSSKESENGRIANLECARALFNYAQSNNIISYSKHTTLWNVGFDNHVEYWQQFYSIWGANASSLYFDPRKSGSLTKSSMRFVFSMMHQRLRVVDPGFSSVRLGIMKFPELSDGFRSVKIVWEDDFELYSLDQLNEMINTTYSLWIEELKRREDDGRKATGTNNPMGF